MKEKILSALLFFFMGFNSAWAFEFVPQDLHTQEKFSKDQFTTTDIYEPSAIDKMIQQVKDVKGILIETRKTLETVLQFLQEE